MTGWSAHKADGLSWLERPGAGPTLVLLHGIGSQAASFTPLLPYLDTRTRVIAWNAPGYGGSAPLPMEWPSAADYANRLSGLLAAVGAKEITVLGHSLGALIAAAFATRHCDQLGRLVLASPALGHGIVRGAMLSAAAQARIDDLARLGPEQFAKARAAGLVFQPEAHPEVVALVERGMAQVGLHGYAQAARMLSSGRLLDDAERLLVRTDVIVGAEDTITPPESAHRAHTALRGLARGALHEIPAAGHAIYQQAPAAFAAALSHTFAETER